MSHTPGPWHVMGGELARRSGRVATIYATDDQELRYLAHVPFDLVHAEHDPTPSEANARLIAAAPDLLAALEALLPHVKPMSMMANSGVTAVSAAYQAVRKARGEDADG